LADAAAARELLGVVGLVEAGDLDHVACTGSVQGPAEVDALVMDVARRVAKEDDVPAAQSPAASSGGASSAIARSHTVHHERSRPT